MKLTMKHFPFLFLLFTLLSCQKKEDTKSNTIYNSNIEIANTKNAAMELDSAFYYFNQAKLACKPNEKEQKIYSLLGIAKIQKINSDFVGLEETATEALSIFENTIYQSYLNNYLGIAFKEQSNFENAIHYYNKTYDLAEKEIDKIIVKNNIAVVYLEQKKYFEAIEILKPLILNDSLKKNRKEFARIADNLGFAYFKNNNDSIAKKYLETSLKIRDSINDDSDKIASYIHLAQFHKKNNPSLAKEFAKKALLFAKNVDSPDDQLEALDLLIKNPDNLDAIQHFESFSHINDSLNKARQIARNQFSKIRFDSKIAIEKNEKLKIENDHITSSFIGFGIITILVFFLIRSKNKREKLKIAYNTETRISKKLHDELANDVFNTMTFIDTQDLQNPSNKESILQGLDSIYDKARNISKQTSEVKTGKEFGIHLNQLLMSYNSKQVNVIVKGSTLVDWEKIKHNKQIEIYRTLSELLVNMRKHSQANLVLINFETLEKTIKIQYSDNGKGFEEGKIIKNGLQNVENRIHAINGSITFDSETNKGLKINIEFPK